MASVVALEQYIRELEAQVERLRHSLQVERELNRMHVEGNHDLEDKVERLERENLLLQECLIQNGGLFKEVCRLRDCLEGMAHQFGHEFERDGRRYLGTMGLSNLEDAFELLGWDDPHPEPQPDPAP